MPELPKKLLDKLSRRADGKMLRDLPTSEDLIDFSSNDYLGFSQNADIFQGAVAILEKRKLEVNGATGSRLLSGNHLLYKELETMLATFHQVESALVFNSGYDANLGFFSCVPQRDDVVFYDELIHASIRDGIKMSGAKSRKFRHNDIEDVIQKCRVERERSPLDTIIYIVTESVFSMDGDSPDLIALTKFCGANGHRLIVDEAHALGIFGKKGQGLVQQLDLENSVFARIVTFGKAIGCHGAAVLGNGDLKAYLVNFARSFVYTTGLPPHTIATILAAYEYMLGERMDARQKLFGGISFFNDQMESLGLKHLFVPSRSAVHCCIVPGNEKVKYLAGSFREKGFDVRPIVSPTVPMGRERLRFCLHAFNDKAQISEVLSHLSIHITTYG